VIIRIVDGGIAYVGLDWEQRRGDCQGKKREKENEETASKEKVKLPCQVRVRVCN
jgi:hypothetical protein